MTGEQGRKIVIATIGSLGDLHPAIALGLGLQARGHEVKIATIKAYRQNIEQTGLSFAAIRPNLSPHLAQENPELVEMMMHPTKGGEVVFRQLLIPAIRDTYEDLLDAVAGYDLLIAGETVFAASLVAEKIGIPWVFFSLQPASFFSIYDPPVLNNAPYLAAFRSFGPGVVNLFKNLGKFVSRDWGKPIDELRKELGLRENPYPLFEGKYSPGLVLAMFSKVLGEPQPDWTPQTQITGFTFYDRISSDGGLSSELEKFLAKGEPPVVFTLGSAAVQTAGNFYIESVAATKQLGCRAVFLVGDEQLENLPDGMIAAKYAPYSEIFPRAAAVVHQGGVGTTAQALRAGVPMIVVPYSHDQPDNAARIVRLGVGRQIKRNEYQKNRIVKELRQILTDPEYRNKAAKIKAILQTEDGVKAACDAIELKF